MESKLYRLHCKQIQSNNFFLITESRGTSPEAALRFYAEQREKNNYGNSYPSEWIVIDPDDEVNIYHFILNGIKREVVIDVEAKGNMND